MAKSPRTWLVDGHNVIFQIPRLEAMQTSGRRRAARRELERILRRVAGRLSEEMVVVYDGNRLENNPDVVTEPGFRTLYAQPPEEADDRIVYLANRCVAGGRRVRVVTSDRKTLASRLPPGVSHLTAQVFRARFLDEGAESDERTPLGDFSDVEDALLRRGEALLRDAETVPLPSPEPARREPVRSPRERPAEPAAPLPPGSEAPGTMGAAARRALAEKRERGRRKQERRLGRMGRKR